MEDQTFSPSHDSVSPHPLFRRKIFCISQSSCVSPIELTEGEGGGVGGAKSYDGEKAWSTMNNSILPAAHLRDTTCFPDVFTIMVS